MTSYVLINVTVPARVVVLSSSKSPAERTVETPTHHSEYIPFASDVRDYIVENPNCEWISEEPFINGKAWWVSFAFSCGTGYAETCIKELHEVGVGDEEDGRGMIHVVPVYIRHVGSRPKECGRPPSLPFGAPASPRSSPRSPSLRKQHLLPPTLDDDKEPDAPDSPQTAVTRDSEVTYVDEEYDDGAELEDETKRLQAKLIAEVEADEDKKDDLHKYTENFAETVKSRVAVDSLVQYVTAASEFSFDYVMLCVIAAIIACIGLVTNNSVVIVASMLVSPLMGPILAQTLGAVLSDHKLVKRGLFSEVVGLALCVVVGFIGGLCAAPANGTTWPTDEMSSRAVLSSLYIGVAIAIPSGMGAALSVMGNNTSSLVGVAISASLLPPAVNSGILFAGAALGNTGLIGYEGASEEFSYKSRGIPGLISFVLTLINIVCIFFSAYAMFEIKEVRGVNTFWKEDVKNARKYNKAVRQDSGVASAYEKAFLSAARKRARSGKSEAYVSPIEKIKINWRSQATSHSKARDE